MDKRKVLIVLFVLLAVGFLLRASFLDSRAFWCDEMASFKRAHLPVLQIFRIQPALLYEVFLHFWLKFGASDVFSRIPSVIFGVLGLIMMFSLSKELFDKKIALLSTLLLVFSPLHIMFSQMNRHYALVFLLVGLSNLFYIFLIRKRKIKHAAGYVLVTIISLYSHPFVFLNFASQGLVFIFLLIKNREKSLLQFCGISQVLIIISSIPFLIMYFSSGIKFAAGTYYYVSQFGLIGKLYFMPLALTLGLTVYPLDFTLVIPTIFMFTTIFINGLVRVKNKDFFACIFLYSSFFLPFLVSLKVPAASPKHIIFVLMPLYIIIALGISEIKRRDIATLTVFALVFLMSFSLVNYYTGKDYCDADMVTPWKDIVQDIESNEKEGDGIVVFIKHSWPYGFTRAEVFKRYYQGNLPIAPLYYNKESSSKLDNLMENYGRLWLLFYEDKGESDKFLSYIEENSEILFYKGYQLEEHTLEGLKEGFKNVHKYESYLYELYLISE